MLVRLELLSLGSFLYSAAVGVYIYVVNITSYVEPLM